MDLRVTGAEDFAELSRHLKEAGAKDLRRELYRALGHEAKQITPDVKKALPEYLPDNYASVLDGSLKMRAATRAGRNPSVKITGAAKGRKQARHVGALDRGNLRHKTWGRLPWHNQAVKPGFFTEPIGERADELRRAILKAMDVVARKITR